MNREPWLVVLAAGMGSRYGGLKQMDPVDEQNHMIIDFSIYDAINAGFKNICFIIKHQIEKEFKEFVGDRIAKHANVKYVYQELDAIPEGFSVNPERVKPLGTGHALLCCKGVVDAPFIVINADDFYGAECFKTAYEFIKNTPEENAFGMVGYILNNTLTDNGSVARGVCDVKDGYLSTITERTKIIRRDGQAVSIEPDGEELILNNDTIVSMNLWIFKPYYFDLLEEGFADFLRSIPADDIKKEYVIPEIVDSAIKENKATVKVLTSGDKWFGVTYKEDKPFVVENIKALKAEGKYPERFLD